MTLFVIGLCGNSLVMFVLGLSQDALRSPPGLYSFHFRDPHLKSAMNDFFALDALRTLELRFSYALRSSSASVWIVVTL